MADAANIGKIGWLDISVEDAPALRDFYSAACTSLGGKIIAEPRGVGGGHFCVIEDPSGAIAALYQEP
jgi:predicted enzyme related to lactoylglutathione lyase